MKNRLAAILAALALTVGQIASGQTRGDKVLPLATLYDLDATTYTFCVTLGIGGSADGDWIPVRTLVTTSGNSTTVTGTSAFTNVAVGDDLLFIVQNVEIPRVVTARASADSITINAAADLSLTPDAGVFFRYRTLSCGTASTSGWFSVANYRFATVAIVVTQLVVTGQVEVKIQCRHSGADNQPIDVYVEGGSTYRTGGYNAVQVDNDDIIVHNGFFIFDQCRVGMLIDSADDGGDLTTNAEQITLKAKLVTQ